MNRVMCLRDQIIRIQKATSCSTVVEAAVLDDVPDGTRLCIVRRLRFLVGAVELKRLVLLQLSRSCSSLLLRTPI